MKATISKPDDCRESPALINTLTARVKVPIGRGNVSGNYTEDEMSNYTKGPWRWELNEKHKTIHLVGGVPQFDLTILEPTRWGMNRASMMIRDTAYDGMNLMHKLHERRDWIKPFPGRSHHADWCADVVHPDMRLIAAAPELLEALSAAVDCGMVPSSSAKEGGATRFSRQVEVADMIRAAIAKAIGGQS